MRGNMKIFTAILLSSFLLTNVASAKGKMIFDLKKQYFSETLIKKGEEGYNNEAKYDLGDVIVTTDTIFHAPSYKYGIFTVDIKEPLTNWNVNVKKKSGTRYEGDLSAIRLTSDNGDSHFITFMGGKKDSIQINNKNFIVSPLNEKIINVTISTNSGKTKFRINGQEFLKLDNKKYGKLLKVEVEVNDNHYDDELIALDISKVD